MDVEEVEKIKVICLGDSAVGKSKFVIFKLYTIQTNTMNRFIYSWHNFSRFFNQINFFDNGYTKNIKQVCNIFMLKMKLKNFCKCKVYKTNYCEIFNNKFL